MPQCLEATPAIPSYLLCSKTKHGGKRSFFRDAEDAEGKLGVRGKRHLEAHFAGPDTLEEEQLSHMQLLRLVHKTVNPPLLQDIMHYLMHSKWTRAAPGAYVLVTDTVLT